MKGLQLVDEEVGTLWNLVAHHIENELKWSLPPCALTYGSVILNDKIIVALR